MISRIEATNFRCLRHVDQAVEPFHVLVGPNASGKTTFLDVISFLGDLVTLGLDGALRSRTSNFEDLLWRRQGDSFSLAVEALLPERLVSAESRYRTIRYQVTIGQDREHNDLGIKMETVSLERQDAPQASFVTVGKTALGQDDFSPEVEIRSSRLRFKSGARKSALASLPDDESQFPATTWFKALLSTGVDKIVLDSLAMRQASPPGQSRGFKTDGSNLPWVVEALQSSDPERFADWIAHLQTALPDLEGIRVVDRPDDRHRYLMLRYRGGLEVPSWTTSDGTLRLLALTLLAYIPDLEGVYLIEEPENGIHPRAVETMYQSLSNVYGAQVLLATHSPIVLSMVDPSQLLCFSKNSEGATEIVTGTEHPALKEWRGETNLATLFAAGVLG